MKTTLQGIGIKEITDFYDLADHLIDVIKKAKADDGKVTVRDFPLFLQLPFKAADAFNGVEDIPAELDEDEAKQLEARNAKFVKDARYAAVVRHLMQAGVTITDIVKNPSAQA